MVICHMTISNSKIEMGIAKSQAGKIYKYPARAKNSHPALGEFNTNLWFFTNAVLNLARIIFVLAFYVPVRMVFISSGCC